MNILLLIPRTLWKCWLAVTFVIELVIFYPAFLVVLSKRERYDAAFSLMRFWAKMIFYCNGIFTRTRREIAMENIPQPCIYVANHTSYLDIVACYVILSKYFVFMGKAELDNAPLFRIFFRDMNILVDRKSMVGSHRAFVRAGSDIDKGLSLFIFPEGTIDAKGNLRPFKNGAFRLAIDKQVPIVPITFKDNWKLLQSGGFFKVHGGPGLSRATIHRPIETKGMTQHDLVSLRSQVFDVIKNNLAG